VDIETVVVIHVSGTNLWWERFIAVENIEVDWVV
jgi:hypothetical protein